MAEMVITSEETRAKMAHAMGLDRGSVLDEVDRGSYGSDDEYLDECTRRELERNSAFLQTRRRLEGELRERQEAQERAEQAEQYRTLRATVKLAPVDVANVEREARRLAERDLAERRITLADLGGAISRYAEKLTERAKDDRAQNLQMNALIRKKT